MKPYERLRSRLNRLIEAVSRYPLTSLFLLAAASVNAADIALDRDYRKLFFTLIVGAFLSAAAQAFFERYFSKRFIRAALAFSALALTVSYYLILAPLPAFGTESGVRTATVLFAVGIAFIWVPSVKSSVTFNETFLAIFKAFFHSLLFSAVLWGGVSIIIAAVDQLLFSIHHDSYSHAASLIFTLFAPVFFLSMIPLWPGASDVEGLREMSAERESAVRRASECPKFLEILISNIIIPLTAVFTVILVTYIVRNIGGSFWTDNLLEPMLVSYSIEVILVYILASRFENRFAAFFRKAAPKALVPIVLFQLVSSMIRLSDEGVTHTRYYVILYGLFAAAAGIVFSMLPVRKNGVAAAMAIVFSLAAVIPPIDAFTVSRVSQTGMLVGVLSRNEMLTGGVIVPNTLIPRKDREKITRAVDYLMRMDYAGKTGILPEDFDAYQDFQKTFGFSRYEQEYPAEMPVYLHLDERQPIGVSGYDILIPAYINVAGDSGAAKLGSFEKQGETYTLETDFSEGAASVRLLNGSGSILLSISLENIPKRFSGRSAGGKELISIEEATFTEQNDASALTIVARSVHIERSGERQSYGADIYILARV